MAELIRAVDGKPLPLTRAEASFLKVRWVLWLLVVPVAWIDSGGAPFPIILWIWVALVAAYNLVLHVLLAGDRVPPARLPLVTLFLDTALFGLLPYIGGTGLGLLTFFSIFPALVGALRFGPQIGLLIAGLLTVSIEVRVATVIIAERDFSALSAALPVTVLLFATALLVGYLSQQEKEAAMRHMSTELEELRHAVAGARLLYQTTDVISTTTSYAPVLEAMLEAGVKGLPPGRKEDPPPVGIVLLFDEKNLEKPMRVVAARHLDRRDCEQRISGREGIVAETLQTGTSVVFATAADDPELASFYALRRCRCGVCYPLQAGLEQYGVVVLAGPSSRRPSDQYLDVMRAFLNQAAVAFQNAKLYQNLREEHDQIIRSENEMRQKLARDLHDGPTQKVAALVMQLDYIGRLLGQNPSDAKAELLKAREVAQQTVREIRTSLFALRPLSLETKGLSAALEQYCERLREAENVPIQIDPGQFGNELDPNIAATVFAIVSEAVNNARKHAAGAAVFVRVNQQANSLVATIQDNGPGFDLDKVVSSYDERSSLGLQSMRDRAKLIDGDLRIESDRGRGTRVTLVVPLSQRSSSRTGQ